MPADPSRRPSRSSANGFWLVLALIVGGVFAVYLFAPQIPRQLFGANRTPADGDEPGTAQATAGGLESREQVIGNELDAASKVARTTEKAKPVAPVQTAAPVQAKVDYKDEAQAQDLLAQANAAYKAAVTAKDWSKATSLARKVAILQAKPATLVRAKDIIRGAAAMEKLFKELDDRDELQRNFDTNPALVKYTDDKGGSNFAVPVKSVDDKTPVESDPVAWINALRATDRIPLLLKGATKFTYGTLKSTQIVTVERADLPSIIAERRKAFEERLARLKNGGNATNALAWYDAAKFAYQNRLDEQVSEMIDRALLLDPLLAQSVREDRAAVLFASLVLQLNNKNTPAAAQYMNMIDKKFADTPSGKEARAFYDAKTKQGAADVAAAQAALRKARQEALARQAEEARMRRDQRIARAKETGDENEIAAAEKPDTVVEDDPAAAGPVSGDEAKADELYAKGKELYQRAIDAGNSDNRDQLYAEANKYLSQAQNLYNTLLEKSATPALEEKAFMCNKLRYGSIKQRRFH